MILGLERLKEVSALQSLGTHSNLSEFTSRHLLMQVYVLHEAGKWKRHVKCRNRVPADLTILSILTLGSCIGLLANRLRTNNQLEVTEYSPWLGSKALREKLKMFFFFHFKSHRWKGTTSPHSPCREEFLVIQVSKSPPKPTTDKRGNKEAWNPNQVPQMQNYNGTRCAPEYLQPFQHATCPSPSLWPSPCPFSLTTQTCTLAGPFFLSQTCPIP